MQCVFLHWILFCCCKNLVKKIRILNNCIGPNVDLGYYRTYIIPNLIKELLILLGVVVLLQLCEEILQGMLKY